MSGWIMSLHNVGVLRRPLGRECHHGSQQEFGNQVQLRAYKGTGRWLEMHEPGGAFECCDPSEYKGSLAANVGPDKFS